MMDLLMNDEQKMIGDMVKDFAENEIRPFAAELDENNHFPEDIFKKMAELGLLGIPIPEEYGGAGMDYLSMVVTVEHIASVCASTALGLSSHINLVCTPILKYGNEDQKKKFLTPLASGECLGAYCLTESDSGSDLSSIQSTATMEGDHYILNGNKNLVTNAGYAKYFLVYALTDKTKQENGVSAFIVEKGTDGLEIGKQIQKLGMRSSDTRSIRLDNCCIPKEQLLGVPNNGKQIVEEALTCGRIGIGGLALGIAQAAFDEGLRYSKERKQFGKTISEFQAIQWMLVEIATNIQASRHLVYYAAKLRDEGKSHTKEASMANLFSSEKALKATHEAIQIHGGYGFIHEYPVERFFRDAKMCEIATGNSMIQRMLIAKELLNGS